MKAYIPAQTAEPVGIVISRGDRSEPAPRFRAWYYEPSPEQQAETVKESKAA